MPKLKPAGFTKLFCREGRVALWVQAWVEPNDVDAVQVPGAEPYLRVKVALLPCAMSRGKYRFTFHETTAKYRKVPKSARSRWVLTNRLPDDVLNSDSFNPLLQRTCKMSFDKLFRK